MIIVILILLVLLLVILFVSRGRSVEFVEAIAARECSGDIEKGAGVLQDIDVADEPLRAGPHFLKLLAAAQTLNKNLEDAHRIFCIFGSQTWGVVRPACQQSAPLTT